MSLFNALMGMGGNNIEEDPIFGCHMSMMRQMNSMMNTFWGGGHHNDPFAPLMGALTDGRPTTHHHHHHHHRGGGGGALMAHDLFSIGGGRAPNVFNQLLGTNGGGVVGGGCFSSSSTVVSMSAGPDGAPQVYKATSSTRTGPGGVRETQSSVTDSRTGTRKMAIGHHIGERAHIVEREQNFRTGDREEREDFINLDEDEADEFNMEWQMKAGRGGASARQDRARIGASPMTGGRHGGGVTNGLLAITSGGTTSGRRRQRDRLQTQMTSPRRNRASPLIVPQTSRTPYTVPGHVSSSSARRNRKVKNVNKTTATTTTTTKAKPSTTENE